MSRPFTPSRTRSVGVYQDLFRGLISFEGKVDHIEEDFLRCLRDTSFRTISLMFDELSVKDFHV